MIVYLHIYQNAFTIRHAAAFTKPQNFGIKAYGSFNIYSIYGNMIDAFDGQDGSHPFDMISPISLSHSAIRRDSK
jgi:hypothetical protein